MLMVQNNAQYLYIFKSNCVSFRGKEFQSFYGCASKYMFGVGPQVEVHQSGSMLGALKSLGSQLELRMLNTSSPKC